MCEFDTIRPFHFEIYTYDDCGNQSEDSTGSAVNTGLFSYFVQSIWAIVSPENKLMKSSMHRIYFIKS
jgi:hypothetical protein